MHRITHVAVRDISHDYDGPTFDVSAMLEDGKFAYSEEIWDTESEAQEFADKVLNDRDRDDPDCYGWHETERQPIEGLRWLPVFNQQGD
jgi:hypothetical protein